MSDDWEAFEKGYSVTPLTVNDNKLYFTGSVSCHVSESETEGWTWIGKVFSMNTFPTVTNSADANTSSNIINTISANGTIYAGGSIEGSSTWGINKLDPDTLKFSQVFQTATNPDLICSDGGTGLYFTCYDFNASSMKIKIYHWNGTTSSDVTSDDIGYGTLDFDSASQVLSIVGYGRLATYKLTDEKFTFVDSADVYGSVAKFVEKTTDPEVPAVSGKAESLEDLSDTTLTNLVSAYGVASSADINVLTETDLAASAAAPTETFTSKVKSAYRTIRSSQTFIAKSQQYRQL